MGYCELKFGSHGHSDTKQPQPPPSCIGRYRGHDLKRPQPRFWPLCWSSWTKKWFFAVISLEWCLMGYCELKFSSHGHSDIKWLDSRCHFDRWRHNFQLPRPRTWPLSWPRATKGPFFLVFLFSLSCLGYMIARSSSYAHVNTKETPLLEPPQLPAGQITKNGHFWRFFHILTVFSVK